MLINSYGTEAPPHNGTFEGWTVKEGKVQHGHFTSGSSLKSVQNKYDAAVKDATKVAAWKKPFIALRNIASNIWKIIKNLFSCFGKGN